MTALMSLRSRLALAKLALYARPEQAHLDVLAPLVRAGVGLVVLGGTGDDAADARALGQVRQAVARLPLLLATDNGGAAKEASADVVHLPKPGLRLFGGPPRGHAWTLMGRNARDQRTIAKPGDDYDYLFVGPIDGADSGALADAVALQPPFADGSLPWFAYGAFDEQAAGAVVAAGARRVALDGAALEGAAAVELVTAVRALLDQAWADDPEGSAFRRRAARL